MEHVLTRQFSGCVIRPADFGRYATKRRNMNTNNVATMCAICGINVATTTDHVPPKNLFVKPRPSLITIPACFDCNNKASDFDEELMIYISLQIGPEQDRTKKLWKAKVLKAMKRNKRFQREIVSQMKKVWLTTKSGILFEKRTAFLAKKAVYDAVFERTVRGLYYHHFNEILGNSVSIEVTPLLNLTDEAYELTKDLPQNEIGGNALVYKYARTAEDPKVSLWVFQFYEKHWVMVGTEPIGA